MFCTSYSYFWDVPQYDQEKPAVIRLAEPRSRKCIKFIAVFKRQLILTSILVVLEVLVAGEPADDYIAFHEEICQEWDYIYDAVCIPSPLNASHSQNTFLEPQETLMFTWCLDEESFIRYKITFECSANFWCFLFHLTKPLPHN